MSSPVNLSLRRGVLSVSPASLELQALVCCMLLLAWFSMMLAEPRRRRRVELARWEWLSEVGEKLTRQKQNDEERAGRGTKNDKKHKSEGQEASKVGDQALITRASI